MSDTIMKNREILLSDHQIAVLIEDIIYQLNDEGLVYTDREKAATLLLTAHSLNHVLESKPRRDNYTQWLMKAQSVLDAG